MLKSKTRINALYEEELGRFIAARPRSRELHLKARQHMPNGVPMAWMKGLFDHPPLFIDHGEGAYITDVDGHRYLDLNVADMSMSPGYAPPAIVRTLSEQAAKGVQFLLPGEDSITVSTLLTERFLLPYWQYTLSASTANAEAMRLARIATSRQTILMFHGGYHGHIDDWLMASEMGTVKPGKHAGTLMVHFNDLAAVEKALSEFDIAAVVAEPAMTNVNLVLPQNGFLDGLRALTQKHGTLLIYDETHTHVCAWGGLTRHWRLNPDILVVGKSIASGIPMGVYGMTKALRDVMESHIEVERWPQSGEGDLAVGGTLFGNALSMAAARTTLTEILTPENQKRAATLGALLADRIDAAIYKRQLPWTTHRLFCRSGLCYGKQPINSMEASRSADFDLNRLQRIYFANRGVWEAVATAGPTVPLCATGKDIDLYGDVLNAWLDEIVE